MVGQNTTIKNRVLFKKNINDVKGLSNMEQNYLKQNVTMQFS